MPHVLHMCMHPYLWNPNVSNGGCRYSVPCDYCILISWHMSADKFTILRWGLMGCLGGGWAKCSAYGARFTINSSPLDSKTLSSGCFIIRWTNFIFPSAMSWGQNSNLWCVMVVDGGNKNEHLPYLSSVFHSVSGGMLISICGQAGQNNARPPSTGWSGQSCTTPARMRLWRSRHCLETLSSSR